MLNIKATYTFICFTFLSLGSFVFSSMVFREWGILSLCSEGIATVNSVSRIRYNSWCKYLYFFLISASLCNFICQIYLHTPTRALGICKRLDGNGNWCKFQRKPKHNFTWIKRQNGEFSLFVGGKIVKETHDLHNRSWHGMCSVIFSLLSLCRSFAIRDLFYMLIKLTE